MQIIELNPFRTLGLLATASERELTASVRKAIRFVDVGKEIKFDFDLSIFNRIERTTDDIKNAKTALERREDRLLHALLWFVENNGFDEIALSSLKAGDLSGAIKSLIKVTSERQITKRNITSLNNLATLQMCSSVCETQKHGIANKIAVIQSPYFGHLVQLVTDNEFEIDKDSFIDTFIEHTSSLGNQNELFEYAPGNIRRKIALNSTNSIFFSIEKNIEELEIIEDNVIHLHIDSFIDKFHSQYYEIIETLGHDDIKAKSASEKIAKVVFDKHNSYYWENEEKIDKSILYSTTIGILKKGIVFVTSSNLKDKYEEEINVLMGLSKSLEVKKYFDSFWSKFDVNIEHDLSSSVPSIISDLRVLASQVGSGDENYLEASDLVAKVIIGKCIEKGNTAQERHKDNVNFVLSELKVCISSMEKITAIEMKNETRERKVSNLNVMKSITRQLEEVIARTTPSNNGFIYFVIFIAILFIFVG